MISQEMQPIAGGGGRSVSNEFSMYWLQRTNQFGKYSTRGCRIDEYYDTYMNRLSNY